MTYQAGAEIELPKADKAIILADKRINESSGIAKSLRYPNIFWTLNDSGGEPCLFAIDSQGKTVAKVRVPKAANFDWEDITGGVDDQGKPSLYIGDIGDNLKVRGTLQIYRIPEPDLPKDPNKEIQSAEPEIWHLAYPKKRHNAECLMMHPLTRELYLLTKEEDGESILYRVPKVNHSGQAVTLEKVTDLSFPAIARLGKSPGMARETTAGDFSPDGRHLIIATYSYLNEWTLSPTQTLAESLQAAPHLLEPPLTLQMEAVCYDKDSRSLWITSEQLPTPLYHLTRP